MTNEVTLYNEDFDVYVESSDAEVVALIQEFLADLAEEDEEYDVELWYDEEDDVLWYFDDEDEEWYVCEDEDEDEEEE